MLLDKIPAGTADEFNVIIEIPAHAAPVKYEMDKDSGALKVDRFLGASMLYPANYGFIPHTLSEDGDPADVLVVTSFPIVYGALVKCRAIAVLRMEDESGVDAKILAVPTKKLCPMYSGIEKITDFPELLIKQIEHFFSHYKDLETGKWVKLSGWEDVNAAKQEILDSIKRYIV